MADRKTLQLEARSTALILHDLQNRNLTFPFIPSSFDTLAHLGSSLAQSMRKAGGLTIYTHVLETDLLHLPTDIPMPHGGPPPPGSDSIAPAAGFQAGDELIRKRQFGAFYGTNLEQQLRRHDVKTLILAGVATELAIESTARTAFDHGYALVFARDAIGGRAEPSHNFFLDHMFPMMGRVASVADIVAALE